MKKNILIVEDEPSIVTLLQYNLKKAGYQTEVALNGEEAVSTLYEKSFDLVILDLMLPDLNGFDVCAEIRQDNVEIPILILTAKNDEYDQVRGFETGANDYVTKPFSPKELLARMKVILERIQHKTTKHIPQKAGIISDQRLGVKDEI